MSLGACADQTAAGHQISESLIIDVRRQLPWRRRVLSDAATAGLWAAWLWLCRPVVSVFDDLRTLPTHGAVHHTVSHVSFTAFPVAIERGLLALLIVTVALWLWQKISERDAETATLAAAPNYAAHFQVSEAQLDHCRASQVCVVHHNADGQIIAIRTLPTHPPTFTAPVTQPETLAEAREFAEAA